MRLKIACLLSICTLLLAQTYPSGFTPRNTYSTPWRILPQIVPNVATNLISQDVEVCYMDVANVTAGPVTLSILDKQGTPVAFMKTVSIAANTTLFNVIAPGADGGCRLFSGGINWQAGAAASINVYMSGRGNF